MSEKISEKEKEIDVELLIQHLGKRIAELEIENASLKVLINQNALADSYNFQSKEGEY